MQVLYYIKVQVLCRVLCALNLAILLVVLEAALVPIPAGVVEGAL